MGDSFNGCPECGSPDVTWVKGLRGDLSPGEWCVCRCDEPTCGIEFTAIMPEPPDRYDGDGVFAENH